MIKAKSYNYSNKKKSFTNPFGKISDVFDGLFYNLGLFFSGINNKIKNNSNYKNNSHKNYSNFAHSNINGVSQKSDSSGLLSKKIRLYLIGFFVFLPLSLGLIWFYVYILRDLPDLSSIEKISGKLAQTINIADRNGNILYKYSPIENREYIQYEDISEHVINAIVAVEDQNFWTNAGIDIQGIIRAGVKDIFYNKSEGASTITQQLIKNLFLTNEKKITRKLKEMMLAIRLDNLIQSQISTLHPNASSEENQKESKKEIIEMYLNYIFLGNNAYGIQSASRVYFGTSANNLDVLQAAIIATLPKAPSTYNPYENRDLVMGKINALDSEGNLVEITGAFKNALKLKVDDLVLSNTEKVSSNFRSFMAGLLNFDFEYGSGSYKITYSIGRKDISLERMYVEGYIDEAQIKNAFLEGLFDFKFEKQKQKINTPHFVYYILDLIKQPNNQYMGDYTQEMIQKGGFTIITSLDSNIQKMAEDSVADSIKGINGYGANNTALIHLDSVNGDILAYVGSADFYNEKINGQVDILRSKKQPGSTIKPLVYALGFMTLPLTLDTDIYDIEFKLGNYNPNNVDEKFMGPMPMRKALAYSRNIPAIKMFIALGGENVFISFLKSLGVTSITPPKGGFGSTMAIGSAEMMPLDLAKAYSHLSAMGKPAKLNPILEIKKFDSTILYKRPSEQAEQIIPAGVAYLLRDILSDTKNLPTERLKQFAFPIKFAGKTGTTNKEADAKGVKYPKDGWMVTYTPSKVTIFWAGNTNDERLNKNAYGGWINNQTWRTFWGKLLSAGLIANETPTNIETKEVTISRLSGKLATSSTPSKYAVTTLGYINNLPKDTDDSYMTIKIDKLCNGKVSDLTPPEDIITSYISQPATFMPNKMDLQDIAKYLGFRQKQYYEGSGNKLDDSYNDVFISEPTQICEERYNMINTGENQIDNIGGVNSGMDTINDGTTFDLSILRPANNAKVYKSFAVWYKVQGSNYPISVSISMNGQNVGNYTYNKNITDIKNISIEGDSEKSFNIVITATDSNGQTMSKSTKVEVGDTDTVPPFIVKDKTTVKKSGNSYIVDLLFSDEHGKIKGGTIYDSQGKKLSDFAGNLANFTTSNSGDISYEVSDAAGNTTKGNIELATYIQ